MYYNNNTIVFLNGSWIKASEATTSLYCQTLHYGYGAFEGIRSYHTPHGPIIFKAKEHYERLHHSARMLHIPLPYKVEELVEASYLLLEKNNLKNAYLRPLLYCHEPNMALTSPMESSLLIVAWQWGKYLGDKLLNMMISSYRRPNPKAFHITAKACGHYVNSTLATTEAKSKGFDEGILLDENGCIAEASGSNFFYEKDGKLYTPPKGNILPGITRDTVFELCEELEIDLEEKLFTPEELKEADSAFLTGTAAEIAGIKSINGHAFPLRWEETLGYDLARKYQRRVTDNEYTDIIII